MIQETIVHESSRLRRIAVFAVIAGLLVAAVVAFAAPGKACAEIKTLAGNYAVLEGGTLTFKYNKDEALVHADAIYTGFDTEAYVPSPEGTTAPWNSLKRYITKVVFDDSVKGELKPVSTTYWFSGMANLKEIEKLKNLDTSQTTEMGMMFNGCESITSIDVSGFNTSNVTKMFRMFDGCSSLTSIDISGFDTSQVTTMSGMFGDCSSLISLNVSNLNVSNVTNLGYMFAECSSLKTIYATDSWLNKNSSLQSAKMFDGCTSLVGGNGTKFSETHIDAEYARIDAVGQPGYFSIKRTSLSDATVSLSETSFVYDGNAKTPSVTVSLGSKKLKEGTDYTVSYSNNVQVGTASAKVTGTGKYKDTATAKFTIVSAPAPAPEPEPSVTTQPMHRLYNPNSGEHFYTSDDNERDNLVSLGWNSEGEGWTAPVSSNTPVYRMYNPVAGEHHYTMDASEKDGLVDAGWNYEGIGWYSDDAQTVPLYRDYNPNQFANNHNYTTDVSEHENLVSLGWQEEGFAWYGV